MCGLFGYIGAEPLPNSLQRSFIDAIHFRGVDAQNVKNLAKNVVLGHTRLAIRGLGDEGNQPMRSHQGAQHLIFNGEIYNSDELVKKFNLDVNKEEMASDTRVLLECFSSAGVSDTLEQVEGMFAFCFFDEVQDCFTFGRDIFGEKPLYYALLDGTLLVASDLRVFEKYQDTYSINHDAISDIINYGFNAGKKTIYSEIEKVEPGYYFTYYSDTKKMFKYKIKRNLISNNNSEKFNLHTLDRLLQDTVEKELISDVPIGVFLSGGIDSSLIAHYAKNVKDDITTYNIGFRGWNIDETSRATEVSNRLKTEHQTFYLTDDYVAENILTILDCFDEPFADSSQLATYFLCKQASKHIRVGLTGDGGDEIFHGYNRHLFWYKHLWKLKLIKKLRLDFLVVYLLRTMPKTLFSNTAYLRGMQGKVEQLRNLPINFQSIDFYHLLLTNSKYAKKRENLNFDLFGYCSETKPLSSEDLIKLDKAVYLPNDVLIKSDRLAMSCSLELRAPFLNTKIDEYMYQFEEKIFFERNVGKRMLRDLFKQKIGTTCSLGAKQGFEVPIRHYLSGILFSWMKKYLSDNIERVSRVISADTLLKLEPSDLNDISVARGVWNIIALCRWLEKRDLFL